MYIPAQNLAKQDEPEKKQRELGVCLLTLTYPVPAALWFWTCKAELTALMIDSKPA